MKGQNTFSTLSRATALGAVAGLSTLAMQAAHALEEVAVVGGNPSESSAEATITANIPAMVKLSNVQDTTFTDTEVQALLNSAATALEDGGNACVWHNPGANFEVKAQSATGGGTTGYRMTSGTGFVEYSVFWRMDTDNFVSSGGTQLATTPTNNNYSFTGADLGGLLCAGLPSGFNASYVVSVAQTEIEAAPVGTYTDTLTLTLIPE